VKRSTILYLATAGQVAAFLVSGAVLGTPPQIDDDAASVLRWFQSNATALRWSLWVGIFGVVLFALVMSIVRSTLPAPHRDVFFFGAVSFAAVTTIQGWIWAGVARHAATVDAGTARTLLDVSSYWGPFLCGATVLTLAPIVVLSFGEAPAFPRWLGVISVVALVEQLVETITIFGDHGFLAPGGPMNLMLGAGLTTLAWAALAVVVARAQPAARGSGA